MLRLKEFRVFISGPIGVGFLTDSLLEYVPVLHLVIISINIVIVIFIISIISIASTNIQP